MEERQEDGRGAMIRRVCGSCKAVAPPVSTDFTLIGPPHQWRVIRVATPEGTHTLDWRCSACWARRTSPEA